MNNLKKTDNMEKNYKDYEILTQFWDEVKIRMVRNGKDVSHLHVPCRYLENDDVEMVGIITSLFIKGETLMVSLAVEDGKYRVMTPYLATHLASENGGLTFMEHLVWIDSSRFDEILTNIQKYVPTKITVEDEAKKFWITVYWLLKHGNRKEICFSGVYQMQAHYDGDNGYEMICNETLRSVEIIDDTLLINFKDEDVPYEAVNGDCYRILCSHDTKKAIIAEITLNI